MKSLACFLLVSAGLLAQDWRPLFNGKNLDRWEVRGDGSWSVMDDGTLFGQRLAGEARNPFRAPFPISERQWFSWSHEQAWLYTVEDFREYDLHVEYRVAEKGNSGISIRDKTRAKYSFGPDVNYDLTPSHTGYEIQIYGGSGAKDKFPTGSVYLFAPAETGHEIVNGWNSLDIESRDNMIRVKLNGHLVASSAGDPSRPKSGPIGLQLHDQFTSAQFRNIKIRKLSTTAVDIVSPLDYQVVQRTSKSAGAIPLKGSATMPCDAAEFRIGGKSWQRLKVTGSNCTFDEEIPSAAGGWYKVEVRAVKNGKPLAAGTVEHVGIGEVFVISGQSNSTNYGETKTRIASGMVSSFGGGTWQLANDPQPGVQDASKNGSFIPAFGDAMYARFKVPIGVACTGFGGTSVRQWLPKGEQYGKPPASTKSVVAAGPGKWESDGKLFDGMMHRIELLGRNGFRALLWHQGESDINQKPESEITPEQYRQMLEHIIRESRARAGWDIPWFVAQVSYHNPGFTGSQVFRDAQASLVKDSVALLGPNTDTLTGDNRQNNGKGVHFSAKGLEAHGKMWAETVGAYLDTVLR